MRFSPSATTTRAVLLVVVLIVLAAAGARLLHLEADFPVQLTQSGAPMSDEGWHSNAAVRYWQFGYWYLPGDVNRAIMQPTFQLLQWITLGALGVSLTTVRLTAVVLFLGLTVLMTDTIRTQSKLIGGMVAMALLTTDFHIFAYSRIALIDLPMLFFVIASLWLLMTMGSKHHLLGGILAGLAYSLAFLTKPTALFAAPLLLLFAALGDEELKPRLRRSLGFLGATVLLIGSQIARGFAYFPQDMADYFSLVSSKVEGGDDPTYVGRAWTAIRIMGGRDLLLCVALTLAAIFLLQHWKRNGLAGHRVSMFYLLATISFFAVIASTHYQPVRYFVPFIALAICVVSIATTLAISRQQYFFASTLTLLVILHIGLGTIRIFEYLAHPRWSYSSFCEELKSDLEGGSSNLLLMGDMAPQISIATGIETISGLVGTRPAAWRFQEYRPTHLITRSPFTERLIVAIEDLDSPELIKTYDVLENYYEGPVYLHAVTESID